MMDANMGTTSACIDRAHSFLGGEDLAFAETDVLWRTLKDVNELALARMVLQRMRVDPERIIDGIPTDPGLRNELCREEALLTSKDIELDAAVRHDLALQLLANRHDLDDPNLDGDGETLGIAGGICKRKWSDLPICRPEARGYVL
jgi:hypothetical protein